MATATVLDQQPDMLPASSSVALLVAGSAHLRVPRHEDSRRPPTT